MFEILLAEKDGPGSAGSCDLGVPHYAQRGAMGGRYQGQIPASGVPGGHFIPPNTQNGSIGKGYDPAEAP